MPTPPPHRLTELDKRVIVTMVKLRNEHHACTVGRIADELEIAKNAVDVRVRKLVEAGWLARTDMPGSLRLADGVATTDEGVPYEQGELLQTVGPRVRRATARRRVDG